MRRNRGLSVRPHLMAGSTGGPDSSRWIRLPVWTTMDVYYSSVGMGRRSEVLLLRGIPRDR